MALFIIIYSQLHNNKSNLPKEIEKALMMTDQQIQSALKYELKMNEMIFVPSQKQTLIDCIASILGIENNKLHEIICNNLKKFLEQYNLPRKLSYIRKDSTIIDDYKKYPELTNFMKITLQMVSQIYETKIILFYINNHGLLTGLIVNEKGYQQYIKIARINNYYYEIKDNLSPYSHHSSAKLNPSSSSHSYKFYQAFDIDQLPKNPDLKKNDQSLAKSYTYIPGSPVNKKQVSLNQQRMVKSIKLPIQLENKQQQQQAVNSNVNPTPVSQIISKLQQQTQTVEVVANTEQIQVLANQQLTESIKFGQATLTQSLTIQKNTIQPQPVQQTTVEETSYPQQQQQQQQQQPENIFFGYYSQYYTPYMMGQNGSRTDNYQNSFNNMMNAPVSPTRNPIKRQNSTLQINENQRYTGRLKFFDEGKNYGFIIMDADQSDIFVHCDDLQKAGINKERVRCYKQSEGVIRFSFKVMSYFGKYKESRKAVQLIILDDGLSMPSLYS